MELVAQRLLTGVSVLQGPGQNDSKEIQATGLRACAPPSKQNEKKAGPMKRQTALVDLSSWF